MRRVVVTGMGMVTPVGRDMESTWSSLQEGRSGVGRISLFDAETFPTKIAAEARGFDLANYIEDAARWEEYCRNTKFAIAAARMAIDHSGLETKADLDRMNAELVKAIGSPEMKARMASVGAEGVGNSPAEFTLFFRNEMEKNGKLIRQLGLKAE